MRRFLFTILSLAAGLAPAIAADKITLEQTGLLAVALRNLDGHMVVVKQNGADNTVMIPWDFGSSALRLRISNNLSIVDAALKAQEDVRQSIIREIQKKFDKTDINPGTPEFAEFQKQYGELVKQPANGTQDLARIRASELKLDKNEIPVTVLSALKPILDDDVSAK